MPATLDQPQVFGATLARGVVTAELQPDGTVRVKNVPLFAEIRPDDPGVKLGVREPRNKEWLEGATARTKARIAMGKPPIMTLRHIFDGPDRVGTYSPERVELAEVNPGEDPRWTVFGDKVYESVDSFRRARGYDARSIEISPEAPNEFGALALLRDKEPFHKFPHLLESLPADARGAFEMEVFRAREGVLQQIWRSAPECFEVAAARDPYAVAQSMLEKGQINKSKFDEVVAAIKRGDHEAGTKEGDMPAAETDKKDGSKAPSLEERMEACMNKLYEQMMAKFEEKFGKATGTEKKDGDKAESAPAETKKAGGSEEPKAPKPEAAQATGGPNDILPPAVSQAAPQKNAAVEAFSAKVALQETAILGLRAKVEEMEREKAAVAVVARAKKSLADMGVATVPEAFEQRLTVAAVKGGEPAVAEMLETVKATMGLQTRQPEAFGLLGQPSFGGAPGQPEDLKKAVEVFGQAPDVKARIVELYGEYRQMPEHFRRSASFMDICNGTPTINPSILSDRGGFPRKG